MRRSGTFAVAVLVAVSGVLASAQQPPQQPPHPTFNPDAEASRGLVAYGTPAVGKPPVILSHGYGGSQGTNTLEPLAKALDAAGYSVFFFSYEKSMIPLLFPDPGVVPGATPRPFTASHLETFITSLKSMSDVSAKLAAAGEHAAALTGSQTITYIGFSAGGVGSLGAVSNFPGYPDQYTLANSDLRKFVITLDAPLSGTSEMSGGGATAAAFFSFIEPGRWMFYDEMGNRRSWYLNGTLGANVTWFLFYSPQSGVVTPAGQLPFTGKPIGTDTLVGTHNDAPTDPANVLKIVNKVVELNPVPARIRQVSSASTTYDIIDQLALAPAAATVPLRIGFGGHLRTESISDIPFASGTSTLTATRNGQVISTQTATDDATEQNRGFDRLVDLEYLVASGRVPLWKVLRWYRRNIQPYVDVAVGQATAAVTLQRTEGTLSRQRFESRGLFGSVGGGAMWVLTPEAPSTWHVSGGVTFEGIRNLPVTRDPPLAAPPGAVLTETDTLGYRARSVQGLVGVQTGRFGLSGGIRGVQRRITLFGDATADFSSSLGVPAVQTIHFDNEYSDNTVEGVAGVEVQIGNTPLIVHADVSGNGGRRALAFGLTYNPSRRIVRGVSGALKPTAPARAESR